MGAWMLLIQHPLPERFPNDTSTTIPIPLHHALGNGSIRLMTDKQAVMDALQRLPEDVTLEEISEELCIMASIRRGRVDIAGGRTKTQEEAEKLLESWATAWTSK
jgi:predicted transcriptional regulator